MRYAQIRKLDISNGPGVRTTLFVSGCTHNCEDCFNKEYQDFQYGKEFTGETMNQIIDYIKDPIVTGVNILGGEPLQQTMDDTLAMILTTIKQKYNKPIWLWTGYKLEDVANNKRIQSILKNVDVLIDGKFEKDKKNLNLMYRGSSNQRVIDMNYYRITGEIKQLKNLTI